MFDKPVVLSASRDILADIAVPVDRRGSANAVVYFQRYAGFDDEQAFSTLMRALSEKLSPLGGLYLPFYQKIPVVADMPLIAKFEASVASLNLMEAAPPTIVAALLSALAQPLQRNAPLCNALRQAAAAVLALYRKNEPSATGSIFSNFVIKQFCWIDRYAPALFADAERTGLNPKVVYYGAPKKHECAFLILLSLLGCDIVVFDSAASADYAAVDREGRFSTIINGSVKKPLDCYPQRSSAQIAPQIAPQIASPVTAPRAQAQVTPPQNTAAAAAVAAVAAATARGIDALPSFILSLKSAEDILEEFTTPLNERVGYAGKPAPILQVYFYRCLGLPDDSEDGRDNYFNRIFLLDRKLRANKNGYLRFDGQLAVPTADDLFDLHSLDLSPTAQDAAVASALDAALLAVLKSGVLYSSGFKPLDNAVVKAFRQTLNLYSVADKLLNPSKLKNFVCKFLFWFNKYLKQLYKNLDFLESPKVLFYGEIKLHEALLLTALSLCGVDVLYLSPDAAHGAVFRQFDREGNFSMLDEKPFSAAFVPFPTAEKAVRQTTVAYAASEQISGIIYGNDTGLFKPWQFEDYRVVPLTLKTTFDELKILWGEQAKLRQGFRAEGGSIYIPNLFAKVNGVPEDINEYWNTLAAMSNAKNTIMTCRVPFTSQSYSNQDLYACAYLFEKNGELNPDKVFASKYYKFGYLRTSLQQHILAKLAELMGGGSFLKPVDDRLKFQILLSVLTLDTKLVNLLGAFDFPADIPKLLIYHNNTDQFSDSDAALLAFLNLMGLDLAIFTPTNYNNLENHLKPSCFDTFQLASVNLQLSLPDLTRYRAERRGLFSRIFNK